MNKFLICNKGVTLINLANVVAFEVSLTKDYVDVYTSGGKVLGIKATIEGIQNAIINLSVTDRIMVEV